MSDAILLDGVSIHLPDQERAVLSEVSLRVPEGELALVVGRTGSGKSTLLGAMCGRVPHFTGGSLAGRVLVDGRDTREHRPRDLADVVGVVGQNPLAGFVTDTVDEELAYAMEQLGLSPSVMRKRVEETLDVLGIADLRGAPLRELSGGQQQRVAIGSVLTAHPRILLLDEPTSALDPTGAEEVLATITRLVHDLGVTVVVAEHRIERVLHYADLVIHIGDGQVEVGSPAEIMRSSHVAPPVVELGRLALWSPLPLSVRDARRLARTNPLPLPAVAPAAPADLPQAAAILQAEGVIVRYAGGLVAVADVSLTLGRGSVTALMGRNGCGKSSLLWALQGTGRRSSGSVLIGTGPTSVDPARLTPAERRRRIGLVPQTASDLLYLDSVGAELAVADRESQAAAGTAARLLNRLAPGIDEAQHPRDLSEGQQLALVLAVQLCAGPEVILLDEPTRGLDYAGKEALAGVLHDLAEEGRSVLVSTHDVEFVAECADRVVVMASGEIVADGPTAQIVVSSPAYAPQVAKILGGDYLTVAQVHEAIALSVAQVRESSTGAAP